MTEQRHPVTFVEFARERMGDEAPCSCGATPGTAHPATCAQRQWWDAVFHAWMTSGRCLVRLGRWAEKATPGC